MYQILDTQTWNYLEWKEKTIKDCVVRLISFHSIDTYIRDIDHLLELWWEIKKWNKDITLYVYRKFKWWKWKRYFNKIKNKLCYI
jgi:hypothetical protein